MKTTLFSQKSAPSLKPDIGGAESWALLLNSCASTGKLPNLEGLNFLIHKVRNHSMNLMGL